MIITMHCHAGEEEAKVVERGGGQRNGLNRQLAPDITSGNWNLELGTLYLAPSARGEILIIKTNLNLEFEKRGT